MNATVEVPASAELERTRTIFVAFARNTTTASQEQIQQWADTLQDQRRVQSQTQTNRGFEPTSFAHWVVIETSLQAERIYDELGGLDSRAPDDRRSPGSVHIENSTWTLGFELPTLRITFQDAQITMGVSVDALDQVRVSGRTGDGKDRPDATLNAIRHGFAQLDLPVSHIDAAKRTATTC